MSPTSYQAAPPRIKTSSIVNCPSATPFELYSSLELKFEAVHYREGPYCGQPCGTEKYRKTLLTIILIIITLAVRQF
tara:strand:+ start:394 stop:624 length:231 start_codon:yes stop_codon:yes gene_type:complete